MSVDDVFKLYFLPQEQPNPPNIQELVDLSGNSYPAKLICEMEMCLLKKLE